MHHALTEFRFSELVNDGDNITPVQRPLFQDNLGKPVQKGKNSLDLNEARDDDGVFWDAVALAGPYANNLHLAADR